MEPTRFIARRQVAEILGVTRARVSQLEEAGKLPPAEGVVRWFNEDCPLWLEGTIREWHAERVIVLGGLKR
jgi:predicted DNA-binding transcriptional regulator AlpA